jgi:3-isopropylmalate dehydratase small subunit
MTGASLLKLYAISDDQLMKGYSSHKKQGRNIYTYLQEKTKQLKVSYVNSENCEELVEWSKKLTSVIINAQSVTQKNTYRLKNKTMTSNQKEIVLKALDNLGYVMGKTWNIHSSETLQSKSLENWCSNFLKGFDTLTAQTNMSQDIRQRHQRIALQHLWKSALQANDPSIAFDSTIKKALHPATELGKSFQKNSSIKSLWANIREGNNNHLKLFSSSHLKNFREQKNKDVYEYTISKNMHDYSPHSWWHFNTTLGKGEPFDRDQNDIDDFKKKYPINENDDITIYHGGSFQFVVNFLQGKHPGYRLDTDDIIPEKYLGLQVQPYSPIDEKKTKDFYLSRDFVYCKRGVKRAGERVAGDDDHYKRFVLKKDGIEKEDIPWYLLPVIMKAKIPANRLLPQNNSYEAAISYFSLPYLKDIQLFVVKSDEGIEAIKKYDYDKIIQEEDITFYKKSFNIILNSFSQEKRVKDIIKSLDINIHKKAILAEKNSYKILDPDYDTAQ